MGEGSELARRVCVSVHEGSVRLYGVQGGDGGVGGGNEAGSSLANRAAVHNRSVHFHP